MRNRPCLAVVCLILACAEGCTLPAHVQGPSWVECLRTGVAPDPNAVTVESALIERPLGDSYLCEELWQDTDELVVGLEPRAALRANGLRVGQLVGTPPAGFQTLLLSPRSCTNPSRLVVPSGKTIPQYLSPVLPHRVFAIVQDDETVELEVDKVRFGFDLQATLTADGRTRLQFTPKIETGENLLPFQASPAESAWVLRIEKPCRTFPELSWEVTLAPGQYVVIGCLPDKANSLGANAFVQEVGGAPIQRLLVIRTNRASARSNEIAADLRSGIAPLALQAAMPTVPGQR